MNKILLGATIILASLFTTPALAYTANCSAQINSIDGLSDTVKQTMIVQCEQNKLKEATTTSPSINTSSIENMDKWSEISLRFAKAIGVAAKEFGVAVDDFLKTDAGKLTAVFIGWQVFGDDLISYSISLIVLLIMVLGCRAFRRHLSLEGYEEQKRTLFGFDMGSKKVPLYTPWRSTNENASVMIVLSYIIQLIVCLIIVLH